jgi:hypothetical protein
MPLVSNRFFMQEGAIYTDQASNVMRLEHIHSAFCEYVVIRSASETQSGVVRGFVKKNRFFDVFVLLALCETEWRVRRDFPGRKLLPGKQASAMPQDAFATKAAA